MREDFRTDVTLGHETSPSAVDRTDLWLDLLRRLSETFPDWAVWKNVDSAMAGTGDVDALAPRRSWPAIQDAFVDWAKDRGYGPVVVCHHVLLGPHLITLEPEAPHIVHLDVKERATFRGSTLIDVPLLHDLCVDDPRGFRRIRAGADGVIRLCSNGILRGGRPNLEALERKGVAQLLASDPDGVAAMAASFGPARDALLTGAQAFVAGGWDRPAMRKVEAWAAARSVLEPWTAVRRQWFARVWKRRCPVMRVVLEGKRRVPDDPATWLAEVARGHDVIATT